MSFISKFIKSLTSNKVETKEISIDISGPLKDFVANEVLPGLDITPNYFWSSFEDILDNFPDGILRDLCNSVELDALSMAMKGIDQEIVDRVVGNLPQKKQAMYEPVEGPKPKREVDDARKIIVSQAKEMEKEGAFNLADMMGGGEMIE